VKAVAWHAHEAAMTARFRVGLDSGMPQAAPWTAEEPPAVPTNLGEPKRRILVVDDDRVMAFTLLELLEDAGYAVEVATDGADGVARAVSGRPDLILLDVNLPPTDGFDTATRIRKSPDAKEVPILFVSGLRDLAERMRQVAIADVDFLRKPFGFDELLTRIERVLDLARARRTLHRQAEIDELTGLGNLRLFQTRLSEEHARYLRYGEPFALVAVDVDKLKRINDEHGHLAGNEALCAIADVLRNEAREVDIPARYGGDEFLIILPHTTLVAAAVFADRVRDAVRGRVVRGLPLSVSIGVASLDRPGSAESAHELLHRADAAAYRAKRAGGDAVCLDERPDL
jgi:two-component system cell cycle response regulator